MQNDGDERKETENVAVILNFTARGNNDGGKNVSYRK